MNLRHSHAGPPNVALERAAGSQSLAAAAHSGRWTRRYTREIGRKQGSGGMTGKPASGSRADALGRMRGGQPENV